MRNGLGRKSARAILDASFRACYHDPRKIDHLIDTDPFAAQESPRLQTPKAEPFTEEDLEKIIQPFKRKSRAITRLYFSLLVWHEAV
jgi:hypothetical protein